MSITEAGFEKIRSIGWVERGLRIGGWAMLPFERFFISAIERDFWPVSRTARSSSAILRSSASAY
jgi:hypothetical protein